MNLCNTYLESTIVNYIIIIIFISLNITLRKVTK